MHVGEGACLGILQSARKGLPEEPVGADRRFPRSAARLPGLRYGDLRVRLSDWIGMAVFSSFGLWWVTFPASVIRFYAWFHRDTVRLPGKAAIRILGLAWVALVVSVAVVGRRM